MLAVVETCAIILNIIVTEQKRRYPGTRKGRLDQEEADEVVYNIEFHCLNSPTDRFELVERLHKHVVPLESEVDHNKLKEVLVENMWAHFEDIAEEIGSTRDEFNVILGLSTLILAYLSQEVVHKLFSHQLGSRGSLSLIRPGCWAEQHVKLF